MKCGRAMFFLLVKNTRENKTKNINKTQKGKGKEVQSKKTHSQPEIRNGSGASLQGKKD